MSTQNQLEKSEPLSNVYCWICAEGNTNLRCSRCKRHFHRTCVENQCGTNMICNECSKESELE